VLFPGAPVIVLAGELTSGYCPSVDLGDVVPGLDASADVDLKANPGFNYVAADEVDGGFPSSPPRNAVTESHFTLTSMM
jgi:hypothetical protein